MRVHFYLGPATPACQRSPLAYKRLAQPCSLKEGADLADNMPRALSEVTVLCASCSRAQQGWPILNAEWCFHPALIIKLRYVLPCFCIQPSPLKS